MVLGGWLYCRGFFFRLSFDGKVRGSAILVMVKNGEHKLW